MFVVTFVPVVSYMFWRPPLANSCHAHCPTLDGLVHDGLELWANLLNLGHRNMVVVPCNQLEYDGVPAVHQSAQAAVHKEEV